MAGESVAGGVLGAALFAVGGGWSGALLSVLTVSFYLFGCCHDVYFLSASRYRGEVGEMGWEGGDFGSRVVGVIGGCCYFLGL